MMRGRMLFEVTLAVLLVLMAAIVWIDVSRLPPAFFDPVGSAVFPRAVAAVIAVLSLVVLVQTIAGRRGSQDAALTPEDRSDGDDAPPRRTAMGAGMYGMLILYAAAMQIGLLGFATATSIFIFVAGSMLGRFRRREMLVSAAVAVILGFGGNYLFTRVFYIDLPA